MKLIVNTIFFLMISMSCLSQNATVKVGSRTGCSGRGICTITSPPNYKSETLKKSNAHFIVADDNGIILRIHRDALTKDESDRILGDPISSKNLNTLVFTIEEAIEFPLEIAATLTKNSSKEIKILQAKTYPTTISEKYIDITIQSSAKN